MLNRRRWLAGSGAGVLGLAMGPPLLAASNDALMAAKPGLRQLNERPLNAETPAHLLADATTPTERLFVRNNGLLPSAMDAQTWQLSVAGESCIRPASFTIDELKTRFEQVSYDLQLECGGNGRAEFRPRASGNQWTTGAIGCPRWRGVRLRDVLDYCGVASDAVFVAYEASDRHLSGDPSKQVISRGVPLSKALEAESLIAFELNGEPIPELHGAPLRLVVGGWPGSVSGKWLTRLLVRNRVHDGPKMLGNSYRVPCEPVAPGADVPPGSMCIIESMPVKSLITSPASGVVVRAGKPLELSGHAWAGDLAVASMAISADFGQTWQSAELAQPRNRLAWQQWQGRVTLPTTGYFEIWARATDSLGRSQPMLVPGWNPKGYLNNACHRVAVQAVA
ncbi:MAG: sulfite oxidase [Pseudomonadaceae bacterium]|nr:sulfite oxidase [Pseudomonadaceae bacterium]